jgi:hypothetical protein
MEKTKVKFPQFTQAEKLRLIFGPHSSALEGDDSAIQEKLNAGRFVLAWDGDNPADCYPIVGALRSVKVLPHHDAHFDVETDDGLELTYKHAVLIHSEELPLMVAGGEGLGVYPMVGRYVGMFTDPAGRTICVLERTLGEGYGLCYYEPQNLAFHSDVTFGIKKEVANG